MATAASIPMDGGGGSRDNTKQSKKKAIFPATARIIRRILIALLFLTTTLPYYALLSDGGDNDDSAAAPSGGGGRGGAMGSLTHGSALEKHLGDFKAGMKKGRTAAAVTRMDDGSGEAKIAAPAPAAATAVSGEDAIRTEVAAAAKMHSENQLLPPPASPPRKCPSDGERRCVPRRYFATSGQYPPLFFEEANANAFEYVNGSSSKAAFHEVPSRPWNEETLIPVDWNGDASRNGTSAHASSAAMTEIAATTRRRYEALLESDLRWDSLKPNYLPPQFPLNDRSLHKRIADAATGTTTSTAGLVGVPPECCPSNANHRFVTKNSSDANFLSDAELADCTCHHPRNYPTPAGPTATIITAFYQMSSKHPVKMYEQSAVQLLATADPMIIFCEPGSRWETYFKEQRRHAPTLVVPLPVEELVLVKRFPQDTFWKAQAAIDPEGSTHHKGVNTLLYVIWNEKLVLLQTAAMLNPFNTTQFLWADAGYWRGSAPHLHRRSAVRINITEEGVDANAALLFQMRPYKFDRGVAVDGNEVLVGGNCFAGTYGGVEALYSAFYETFWTMAATGKFVGSDQKVLYRTCHAYPGVCHVHKPRRMRSWLSMLGQLLPGLDGDWRDTKEENGKGRTSKSAERIGAPLELEGGVGPEDILPVPPNGPVDDAMADWIWRGVTVGKEKK